GVPPRDTPTQDRRSTRPRGYAGAVCVMPTSPTSTGPPAGRMMTLSTEHPAPTARRRDRTRTSTPDPFLVSALLSSPADARSADDDHPQALPLEISTEPGFTAGTASASVPATHGGRTYRVRRGDDLVSVAARFGVSVPALVDLNGLSRRPLLRPGQIVSLPERQVSDGPATDRARPGDT